MNPAAAQKKYDPGATDNEIKIGNIMPYSGPLSAYAPIGRVEAAFFNRINAEGGINGRKINFITYDDAFSPPKTVEQARKLVESDEVLLIFNSLGTPTNNVISGSKCQDFASTSGRWSCTFHSVMASVFKIGHCERRLINVRFGPVYGLKSYVSLLPKSAVN